MEALILKGKKILKLGYPEGKVVGVIINTVMKNFTADERAMVLTKLKELIRNPAKYHEDKIFGDVVLSLTGKNCRMTPDVSGTRAPEAGTELCGRPA